MADEASQEQAKKRRTFRKYQYRGVDLEKLLGKIILFLVIYPNNLISSFCVLEK